MYMYIGVCKIQIQTALNLDHTNSKFRNVVALFVAVIYVQTVYKILRGSLLIIMKPKAICTRNSAILLSHTQ